MSDITKLTLIHSFNHLQSAIPFVFIHSFIRSSTPLLVNPVIIYSLTCMHAVVILVF